MNLENSISEIWKPIKGYEEYEVSNYGNVRSIKKLHRRKGPLYMKPMDNGYGYYVVTLWKKNKRKNQYIHRLVAEAFIPNPDDLPQVNHLDYDRHNNSVSNLEWITQLDNTRYSAGRGRHPRPGTKSKTGEKYIYRRRDMYRVSVYNCKEFHFKSFEDAIAKRNSLMKEMGYEL